MFLWVSGSLCLSTFMILWKLFNYFKTYTFVVSMPHLNCLKITLNTLIFAAFFSVTITWLFQNGNICVLPNVYFCVWSLYMSNCNDENKCSKLILKQKTNKQKTSRKHRWEHKPEAGRLSLFIEKARGKAQGQGF